MRSATDAGRPPRDNWACGSRKRHWTPRLGKAASRRQVEAFVAERQNGGVGNKHADSCHPEPLPAASWGNDRTPPWGHALDLLRKALRSSRGRAAALLRSASHGSASDSAPRLSRSIRTKTEAMLEWPAPARVTRLRAAWSHPERAGRRFVIHNRLRSPCSRGIWQPRRDANRSKVYKSALLWN